MIFESQLRKINLEELNVYELLYFNELLKQIFKDRKEIEEKRIKQEKMFIYYKIDNLNRYENIIGDSSEIINKCKLILSFNCNTFKELLIKVELDNDKYNKIISVILKKVTDYLLKIKNTLKDNKYIDNYFFECFQLSHGAFSGYYKFKNIELDFGKRQQSYHAPIIVKTKIKYKKIVNDNFKNNTLMIDSLRLDRDICLTLIQLFLRTNFELITNGAYSGNHDEDCINKLNDTENGKLTKCDRNKFIQFHNNVVTDDIDRMFEIFDAIEYEEKSVFLQACEAYAEGLKSNNGKKIMFFVIALEVLANYEYDDSISKADKIYCLISNLYNENLISSDYIDYIYELRSLYSHQGISNNRIKQNIFGVLENDSNLIRQVEEITYSSLIRWLINKGENNGI